jgi:hypothetical protein
MTISILEQYDRDKHIPFFGFGAKLPPFYTFGSACFAINGNIFKPEELKAKGLLNAYNRGVRQLQFHGPAALAPVI